MSEPTTPNPYSRPSVQPSPTGHPDRPGTPSSSAVAGRPGGLRGWPRAALVTVLAACLVAVGAVAFGITMASARTSTTAGVTPLPGSAAPTTPGAGAGGGTGPGAATAKHRPHVRGTLTAMSGDTWTVRTAKSGTVTATIAATTTFGSPKAPAKRSDFAVGDPVVVVGAVANGSVKAVRVAAPQHQGAGKGADKATPTGAGSGSGSTTSSSAATTPGATG